MVNEVNGMLNYGSRGRRGITPKVMMNSEGEWFASYDKGKTWIDLEQNGKGAQGDKGDPGVNGRVVDVLVDGASVVDSEGNASIVLPVVPTNVSAFNNDAGYLTAHQSLADYRKSADQDVIDDAIKARVTTIEGKEAGWDAKYDKPSDGIPKTDLVSSVQTSLGLADTALQSHQSLADYSTTAQMNAAISAYHDATKQDVIGDLATIRSGAALGATALQTHQDISGKLDASHINHNDSWTFALDDGSTFTANVCLWQ